MSIDKTVFSQLMGMYSPYDFRKCVDRYNGNYRVKKFLCRDQYLCMAFAQLVDPDRFAGKHSGLHPYHGRQGSRCKCPGCSASRSRFDLSDGSWISRFQALVYG